jgi:hypothetical protein
MSDISLQFTWWQVVLLLLAMGFWPFTLAAIAAAIWVWRKRTSRVARVSAIAIAGLWVTSAGMNLYAIVDRAREGAQYESELRSRQKRLAAPTVVAGARMPPGTIVTRDANDETKIAAVDVPVATEIHGIPVVGHVAFSGGAFNGDVTLARDSRIAGVPCSAHEPVRFDSGKLIGCRLAEPVRIRGIPCAGSVDFQSGVVCILASDYSRFGFLWRAQTKLTDFGDLVWFRIGSLSPSLYALGSPLAADSEVQFAHGQIASVDLQSHPAHFRDCTIDLMLVHGRTVEGRAVGACHLPQVPPGLYVRLPPTALQGVRSSTRRPLP